MLDRASLERLHEKAIADFGRIDILVNAAGITKKIPVMEWTEDLWSHIMAVNLTGTLRGCQIFGRSMLEQGYGRIINICSLSTYVAFHEVAAYGAAKAAVGALTKSLAVEWANRGVCVNGIAPGIVPTALNRALLQTGRGQELLTRTPMKRYGTAEEIVGTAVYLASDAASFTTGEIVTVDGGFLSSGVNQ